MRGAVQVWPEPPRRDGDAVEAAARIEWPWRLSRALRARRQRVWIRVPAEFGVSDDAVPDAMLLGVVFGAMRLARGVRLRATASRDLVEGLGRLTALWAARRPDKYRAVPIACDGLREPGRPRGPALLCFSGGLDSAYSLHRLTRPDRPAAEPAVGATVMVRGADIPVEEKAAFRRAFARARAMTASREVAMLEAATNLRAVKQNWTHSCAATLAAVMHLGRGRFGQGLVAVGFTAPEARAWWPQDLTDPPLFSTGEFPLAGDGYEADRFEKMLAIRGWREGLAGLRVCYRKGVWDRNCGTCFKCLVAGFFAKAATGEDPPFLDRPLGEEEARLLLANTDVNSCLRLHQLRRGATRLGVRAPWLDETARLLDARGVTEDAAGVPVVPRSAARVR